MHFTTFIIVPLAVMGIAITAPTYDEQQDWKITTNRHGHEERHGRETIWFPIDCPSNFSMYEIAAAEGNLDRRYQLGGVYVCTQVNWRGICAYDVLPLHQCFDLAPMWAGEIAALGPDNEDFGCTLFSGANLSGNRMNIIFPGFGNLTEQGWGKNTTNPVLGIICWRVPNIHS
jgi:hypothetical protein